MTDVPPPAARPGRAFRVLQTAVRVAVMVLICVAGWWLADFYRSVFTDGPASPIPGPPAAPDVATPVALRELLFGDGAWSLGDSQWRLRPLEVDAAAAQARFADLGTPLSSGRPESVLEHDLLERVRRLAPAGRRVGECRVYEVPLGQARARVVTQQVDGNERFRLGQAAWGGAGASWNLIELTPDSTAGATPSVTPLLPVPPGAELLARRWAGQRVLAEVVGPWPDDSPLPAVWEEAGWVGRPLDPGGEACTVYRAGAETVHVWRFSPLGGGGYLLLVRLPEGGRRP